MTRALAVVVALAVVLAVVIRPWGGSDAPQDDPRRVGDAPPLSDRVIEIAGPSVTPVTFNPSVEQSTTLRFELDAPATVTATVHGPNRERVRTLVEHQELEAGPHALRWDGTLDDGTLVADEAYTFRVEATNDDGWGRFDPVETSGGEKLHTTEFGYKPSEGLVRYKLGRPARVLVRAGIERGPMLSTIVNWQPRARGACVEPWAGKDAQGLRSIGELDSMRILVQAYALPDHVVLTTGNVDRTYAEQYEATPEADRVPPPVDRDPRLEAVTSPHWSAPAHLDKDPPLAMGFPELEGDAPTVTTTSPTVLARVDVPEEAARAFVLDRRFEIVTFVDDERVSEAEAAQLPFNWECDLTEFGPGEHVLTINLVTFEQHVGCYSRRVEWAPDGEDGDGR